MEQHSCRTYFALNPENGRTQAAERDIQETLGVAPVWGINGFIIGNNKKYDVNVNEMLRVTLKDLFGKEARIKALCEQYSLKAVLEIVPYIVSGSEEPSQILSLEWDIIEFLYRSGAEVDLDYYVI